MVFKVAFKFQKQNQQCKPDNRPMFQERLVATANFVTMEER
jgi:hypothetical protein